MDAYVDTFFDGLFEELGNLTDSEINTFRSGLKPELRSHFEGLEERRKEILTLLFNHSEYRKNLEELAELDRLAKEINEVILSFSAQEFLERFSAEMNRIDKSEIAEFAELIDPNYRDIFIESKEEEKLTIMALYRMEDAFGLIAKLSGRNKKIHSLKALVIFLQFISPQKSSLEEVA